MAAEVRVGTRDDDDVVLELLECLSEILMKFVSLLLVKLS